MARAEYTADETNKTQPGGLMESEEFYLASQMRDLAKQFFSHLLPHLPALKIQWNAEDGHGPAWLEVDKNAQPDKRTGTIYIDARVSTFTTKTTKILILHELIHYSRYLKDGTWEDIEDEWFRRYVAWLWQKDAYRGLL